MSRLVIVVEKASDWGSYYPSDNVVTAQDYLKEPVGADDERTQVINLCRTYKYLGTGYYVSLLAEARGHKVIPSVRAINDLRRRSLYGLDIDDLNQKLQKFLPDGGRDTTDFGVLLYFGETSSESLEDIARQVFEAFPCPILRIEFERERVWQISAIKPTGLHTLSDPQEDAFAQALDKFSKKLWRKPRAAPQVPLRSRDAGRRERSDAAVEQARAEALRRMPAPSSASKSTRSARTTTPSSPNTTALFIRETTALDNHTYRFANKAEKEDMVVIDDPSLDPEVHEQDLSARSAEGAQAADAARPRSSTATSRRSSPNCPTCSVFRSC